ncbi:MAG: APC family permease [Chloroflexi bacterium]|nr:APC family permease [Chloroflexota bacterium]
MQDSWRLRPGDRIIRRPRVRHYRLRRVLGVPALFSSAYGNVGSSIYYALGVVALYALGLTPLVLMLAAFLFACTALSYAEGTAAIPEAGGSCSFARRAFNDLVGFVAGWTLSLDYIITIAISAFIVPGYLAFFLPALKTWPINSLVGIGVVVALATINVIGVKESARVNIIFAILDLATQGLIVLISLIVLLSPSLLLSNIHWGIAPTWGRLIYGLSIAMIAYTGIETISNLAEETRRPERDIPRSVSLVFGAVLIMYASISLVALSAMPVVQENGVWTTELATRWLEDPIMGIVNHLPSILSSILGAWVGLLAATILIIATNAGILGLSRLTYYMGQHRQLPPLLSRIHPRHHTPSTAIIVYSVVAILLIVPGRIGLLADLYSFGAMLAFTFAHLSVIALRIKEPDMSRPYRSPLNVKFRGHDIPLLAVLGGMGTFITWLVVVYTHQIGRSVGLLWLAAGLVIYIFYRRRSHLSLTQSVGKEERGIQKTL